MFRPRVIPVLLLKDRALVKSRSFKNHRYIGDPINAVKIFNEFKADELIFLDISASKEDRLISLDFVKDVGAEASMPFAVGGGIRSLDSIQDVIRAGAEKVVIGSSAVKTPAFIRDASEAFGSSTIAVCIDVKKSLFRGLRTWALGGTRSSRYAPVDFARLMEENGAGEIIVQSVERDGSMRGYDISLVNEISRAVTIPVIALGGAGHADHLREAHYSGHASGLGAGSLFVFHGRKNGVLINYPDRKEILEWFKP